MPTAELKAVSRHDSQAADLVYIVQGASGSAQARDTALAEAGTSYEGLPREDATAEEVVGTDDVYEVTVRYASTADEEDGTIQDTFELAMTPVSVLQSRQTVSTIAAAGHSAPNFNQAINVDQDGRVQGIEWPVAPSQVITRTATIEASRITQSYYRTLSASAGKVNDAGFLGFNARELMFLGASGSREGITAEDPWKITYRFGVLLNATGIVVAPGLTIPSKDGWDYAWAYYRFIEDAAAKALVPRPIAVYVERVALEANFSALEP